MISPIVTNIICTMNTIITNNHKHEHEQYSSSCEKIITILLVCMVVVALGFMIWACT